MTSRFSVVVLFCSASMISACAGDGPAPGSSVSSSSNTPGQGSGVNGNCGSVTHKGKCQNGVVTWCDAGELRTVDCVAAGHGGCGLVGAIYDCTGRGGTSGGNSDAKKAYLSCKSSCKTQCKELPCDCMGGSSSSRYACGRACASNIQHCAAGCPCACYPSSPTGNSIDHSECATSCRNVCSVESSKCMAACGGNYSCGSKCTDTHSKCITSGASKCWK